MAKISKRKAGATALAVSMLTGTAVANAANIVPKNPVPAGSCLMSQYQPGLGCPDWADEFNGTEVNKDFWNVYDGYSEVNQDPYGRYMKDAVTVKDGQLHLTTKVGANGQKGQSAEMTTNNKAAFEDGYWEFKVSSYSGFGHVGGYLYGNGNVAGPQQGEIDGYEAFGSTNKDTRNEAGKKEKFDQSNKNQSIIHYSQGAIDAQSGKKVSHGKATWFPNKPVGEPVIVGILKTADGVKIFRDGILVQEMKSTDPNYAKTFPVGQPLNTTLTARVSNVYWGLQSNPTGGISFDYVRHYPLVTALPSPSASPSATAVAPKPVETTEPTVAAPIPSATAEPKPSTVAPSPAETTATPTASPTPTLSVEPTVDPKPSESAVPPSVTPTVEVVAPAPTIDAPKPVETTAIPAPSPKVTPTEDASKPTEPTPSATVTSPSPIVTVTPSSEPSVMPSPTASTSPSPSASENVSPPPTSGTATAEVTTPSTPTAPSSEKSSNDLVPEPSASPSQQASPSPSTESLIPSPEGDEALKNKSGDRVVDSSNPSSIKGSDALSTSNDSTGKPKQPVVAQTGHDTKSGGWVTAGIAAIVVGVIAVAGWFFLFKSHNDNDGQ